MVMGMVVYRGGYGNVWLYTEVAMVTYGCIQRWLW